MAVAYALLGSALPALAQPAPGPAAALPPNAAELLASERFRHLATELRCLVCQNQTLADSNAPLAMDLRNEVVRLMADGADDRRIKAFLVDRYGEFVLYRPSLSARNAVLWFGPFLLLAIGGLAWWRLGRRPPASTARAASGNVTADDALRRVDALLEPAPPPRIDGER